MCILYHQVVIFYVFYILFVCTCICLTHAWVYYANKELYNYKMYKKHFLSSWWKGIFVTVKKTCVTVKTFWFIITITNIIKSRIYIVELLLYKLLIKCARLNVTPLITVLKVIPDAKYRWSKVCGCLYRHDCNFIELVTTKTVTVKAWQFHISVLIPAVYYKKIFLKMKYVHL